MPVTGAESVGASSEWSKTCLCKVDDSVLPPRQFVLGDAPETLSGAACDPEGEPLGRGLTVVSGG
jgi:hypothetical protein